MKGTDGCPRILLVDDEVHQLQLRAEVMKSCGFSVVTADGPARAICRIASETGETTAIAVLDYNMPVMNGSALASTLRFLRPGLKIILHSGALDIPQSDLTNVDAYVPKSEGVKTLVDKVIQLWQFERQDNSTETTGRAA